MADELRGDLSEADVAAVVRNNSGAVVDAIRNQAIEPSEVESDLSSSGVSDVEELSVNDGASNIRHAEAFDGADGGERVQAAVDDLPSSGGKVVIAGETHTVSSRIDVSDLSDVTLKGCGESTVLKASDGVSEVIYGTDPENIKIKDLFIDQNGRNNEVAKGIFFETGTENGPVECEFDNITVYDGLDHGLHTQGPKLPSGQYGRGHVIRNCTFHAIDGGNDRAIYIGGRNGEYTTIENCHIHENNIGIYLASGNVEIQNNQINHNLDSAIVHASVSNSGKCLIEGNTMNHNQKNAYRQITNNQIHDGTDLLNNVIRVTFEHAVIIDGMQGGQIKGNNIWAAGTSSDDTYDAIILKASNKNCQDNDITGNYAESCYKTTDKARYGINESAAGVSGNHIEMNRTQAQSGFPAFNSTDVANNTTL